MDFDIVASTLKSVISPTNLKVTFSGNFRKQLLVCFINHDFEIINIKIVNQYDVDLLFHKTYFISLFFKEN